MHKDQSINFHTNVQCKPKQSLNKINLYKFDLKQRIKDNLKAS